MIYGYTTVKEMSVKWGIAPRTIQIMCAEGKIPGATKFGRAWAIPTNTTRPSDGRVNTGAYKNWRKNGKEKLS